MSEKPDTILGRTYHTSPPPPPAGGLRDVGMTAEQQIRAQAALAACTLLAPVSAEEVAAAESHLKDILPCLENYIRDGEYAG
jgi:hypothetical protein